MDDGVLCPREWYVNITSRGCFSHVSEETCTLKHAPAIVCLLVGTNDLTSGIDRSRDSMKNFMLTSRVRFPDAEVYHSGTYFVDLKNYILVSCI